METAQSPTRRIVIVIGLLLALGLPFCHLGDLGCWEVDGAAHSEAAWGSRASMALMYLFGGQREVSDVAA